MGAKRAEKEISAAQRNVLLAPVVCRDATKEAHFLGNLGPVSPGCVPEAPEWMNGRERRGGRSEQMTAKMAVKAATSGRRKNISRGPFHNPPTPSTTPILPARCQKSIGDPNAKSTQIFAIDYFIFFFFFFFFFLFF
ncbi:hypothetical protein QG37_04816 [Candidozyma auris]|uniref:Uncharacterized protein n=1 Tax=Candidozyma auris TaxID=498019 RepID=A0A0L0NVV0_CANAR|nr:hypothetical protein QG37_04816 [[Candida] auris]